MTTDTGRHTAQASRRKIAAVGVGACPVLTDPAHALDSLSAAGRSERLRFVLLGFFDRGREEETN